MAQANKTRRVGRNRNESEIALDIAAVDLSRNWHGRSPKEITKICEKEIYDEDLAKLADLIELVILHPSVDRIIPVSFRDGKVNLCGKGNNLFLIGGNQTIDIDVLIEELGLDKAEIPKDRQYMGFGEIYSIVYFTDKWHLTGPATQKKGMEYEHIFAEQDPKHAERPEFVYDTRNKKILIIGGSYEIRSEGIWN